MKEFCLIILLIYFGFKFIVALIAIINWNEIKEFEAEILTDGEESSVPEKKAFVQGLFEHSMMLVTSIILYLN